jgi:hypothetical protein
MARLVELPCQVLEAIAAELEARERLEAWQPPFRAYNPLC